MSEYDFISNAFNLLEIIAKIVVLEMLRRGLVYRRMRGCIDLVPLAFALRKLWKTGCRFSRTRPCI